MLLYIFYPKDSATKQKLTKDFGEDFNLMELEDENPFGLDSFSPKVDDYGFAKTLTSSTSSSSNVGS